jgi:DNA-binding transcriptional LysR family regulator
VDLLAQMETFVRLVDGKSLSAAARARRMSLPAVSRQLRALEEELGTSLVVRSTRKLHVTDAGMEWYARCLRVLREVDEAKSIVRGTKQVQGKLVVSASFSFGMAIIVPRLAKLVGDHPRLQVDLRLEDHLVDLVGEGVDVAVRAGTPPPNTTAFLAQPIFQMDRLLVASPRYLRRLGTPRTPHDLERATCLVQVTPAGTTVAWELRRDDERRVVDVRAQLRCNTPNALRALALADAGIAYVPDWLVQDELERGALRRVLPEWRSSPTTAWAVYRAELRGSPRMRAFLACLPKTATV